MWNFNAESESRFDVYSQIEFSRLLDRDVARFGPTQYLINNLGDASERIGVVRSVGHKSSGFGEIARSGHHRDFGVKREGDDAGAINVDHRVLYEINSIHVAFERTKSRRDIVSSLHTVWHKRESKLTSRSLNILSFPRGCGISRVKQNSQRAKTRNDFAQKSKPLACDFGLLK